MYMIARDSVVYYIVIFGESALVIVWFLLNLHDVSSAVLLYNIIGYVTTNMFFPL